ncbi:transglycosylase SLT domain-containing protein [Cellvibrio sp. pealriver]|uniref:transglycosylase SLT domain-containing protein n=1 Tax=Cellvibrio sp. pealriver TaxID=1622269 RepID=UPI00066FF3B1|nr:transglycosylase SLT domain-containing protein [Cellvibrio sp. pealriver]
MQTFAIKHRAQLTWEDLPFVEAPVFAHTHIMQMLNNPNHLWMRIENLPEFIRTEIGSYSSLRNHDYANNKIERLIGSGLYFNVCRTGKPFCAAFTWQEDSEHPHKGFWTDPLNYYWRASVAIKNQLMLIANQWHRLQTLEFTESLLQSPFAIAQEKVEEVFSVANRKPESVMVTSKAVVVSSESKAIHPKKVKSKSLSGSPYEDDYDEIIWKASKEYGVPPEILKAKIRKESTFNNEARNTNNVDASTTVGLGQFTESTAMVYGLRVDESIDERLVPAKTIPAQAKMLRKEFDRFRNYANNDIEGWRFALASYNLGYAKVYSQLEVAEPYMDQGKVAYNHSSMTFCKGSYTPTIMGLEGDIGGWAKEYSHDFLRFK